MYYLYKHATYTWYIPARLRRNICTFTSPRPLLAALRARLPSAPTTDEPVRTRAYSFPFLRGGGRGLRFGYYIIICTQPTVRPFFVVTTTLLSLIRLGCILLECTYILYLCIIHRPCREIRQWRDWTWRQIVYEYMSYYNACRRSWSISITRI